MSRCGFQSTVPPDSVYVVPQGGCPGPWVPDSIRLDLDMGTRDRSLGVRAAVVKSWGSRLSLHGACSLVGSGHKGSWMISEPFLGCCTCFST